VAAEPLHHRRQEHLAGQCRGQAAWFEDAGGELAEIRPELQVLAGIGRVSNNRVDRASG
jgi:hypothetical protein